MEKIAQIKQKLEETDYDNLQTYLASLQEDERQGVKKLCLSWQKKLDKREAEKKRIEQMSKEEEELSEGLLLAGIDEAGRGPLAGPVVASAVIMPKDSRILYINDSKKLSREKREELFIQIKEEAISYGIGIISPAVIDEVNILNATYQAMTDAVGQLTVKPQILLNDAVIIPNLDFLQKGLIKGDARCYSIACASILAKVTRDEIMEAYDRLYPQYGFKSHKGYGSAAHIEALKKFGPCPIHRTTFIGHFI